MTNEPRFELDLCGDKIVENPDRETLSRLIQEHAFRDDFFAILVRGEHNFMQTAGSDKAGTFVLEVQEGSLDDHRRCTDTALLLITVIEAMTSYLEGNDDWRTSLQWEPYDLNLEAQQDRRSRMWWWSIGVVVASLLLLYIVLS